MAARKAGTGRERSRRSTLAALPRRLVAAFSKVTRDLDAIGAKCAVIGGLAVGARVEPRTTKDIDFAVDVADDAAAEALIYALGAHGYRVSSLFQRREDGRIATVRTHGSGDARMLFDYLFASTLIEREIVSAASHETLFGVDVPVARYGHLREARDALRLMQVRGAEPDRDLVADLRRLIVEARKPGDLVPVTGAALRRFQRPVR